MPALATPDPPPGCTLRLGWNDFRNLRLLGVTVSTAREAPPDRPEDLGEASPGVENGL